MIASVHALIDIIASATPALYNAFASAMPLFGTDDEPTMMSKLYGPPGRDQLFRSSPGARPGAARGSGGNRNQMERSRGPKPRFRIYPIGRLTAALDGKLLKAFGSQGGLDRLLRPRNAGWLNHVFGSFPDRTVACSKDGSLPEIQKASRL